MYIELHARSAFSFLEGSSTPEELAGLCAERDMPAMALLDRDGVYGSPRFHLAAEKAHIRAHIGVEVTSAEGWRYPLLVESRAGYQNLCRLITRMKLRAKKGEGCVSSAEVAESSQGLICLTGGEEGPLAFALKQGGIEAAAASIDINIVAAEKAAELLAQRPIRNAIPARAHTRRHALALWRGKRPRVPAN